MATAQHTTARRAGGISLDEQFLGNIYDHSVARRLFAYVMAYRGHFILSVLGVLGWVATITAQPLIIAWGVDGFITPKEGAFAWGSLNVVAAAFLVNHLLQMGAQFVQLRSITWLSAQVLYDLRRDMFHHLQAQPVSFFDRNEVGRLMSRVQNDTLSLQEFLEVGTLTVADVANLFVIAAVMFSLDPFLAAVALSLLPALVVIMAVWQRYAKPTFIRIRAAISVVNGSLQENITGVRVTQSMNRQAENLRRFDRLNTEHLDAAVKGGALTGALMPPMEMVAAASMGLVLIVGGMQVFNGQLGAGVLIAFLMYVFRFYEPIRTLTMQFTQFQKAMASGARIFELLDTKPTLTDRPGARAMPPIRGEVEFRHVTFEYVPGQPVLQDVDLHILPGQSVAFVGLTGAGKTTLVSLVPRFYDVTLGSVLVDGIDVRDVTRASLARQMSMVLQEPFLFSESVEANIRFNHPQVTRQQVEAAARAVGAHDFIVRLPQGYDTVLEQRGGNLSMGQRQLISMARAIVNDPRILILDEATANMDSETERMLQEALREVLRGRTSLIIAHRLSTITSADRIVVLERGRVVETGTHLELLERGGVYARLYAMNFGEAPSLESPPAPEAPTATPPPADDHETPPTERGRQAP